MFPSPGRAVMALGHGAQASTATTATGAMAAASSSSGASTFSFQPSPPAAALTSALSHHGLLGYSPLVLDHPTTTTTTSSHAASSTIQAPTLHDLHAPPTIPQPPRSSPPHPWSCEEGDHQDRQRGKGAVMGMGVVGVNSAAAGGSGGGLHGSAATAAGLGVGAVRMKKAGAGGKARRKVREPRFCFKTMSDVDVLDDGYKWRKYGQKVVKNTQHPRSYYRCTQDDCRVKKRVERLAEDPRMVITTYEGRHVHSPSRDGDDDAARANAEMNFIW